MFELTYRCNFRCIHCYNSDEQKMIKPKDELKTKEIFKIMEELRDLGGFYFYFFAFDFYDLFD